FLGSIEDAAPCQTEKSDAIRLARLRLETHHWILLILVFHRFPIGLDGPDSGISGGPNHTCPILCRPDSRINGDSIFPLNSNLVTTTRAQAAHAARGPGLGERRQQADLAGMALQQHLRD